MFERHCRGGKSGSGFTLIELLIVVAIIAILAAIAIPNFLEAQTRSKVSRTHNDLRTLAVGLESYASDYTKYPPVYVGDNYMTHRPFGVVFHTMTTPVAYLTSIPRDPFNDGTREGWSGSEVWKGTYYYYDRESRTGRWGPASFERNLAPKYSGYSEGMMWMLKGYGPDRDDNWSIYGDTIAQNEVYDPTNGTISIGDIYRWGP